MSGNFENAVLWPPYMQNLLRRVLRYYSLYDVPEYNKESSKVNEMGNTIYFSTHIIHSNQNSKTKILKINPKIIFIKIYTYASATFEILIIRRSSLCFRISTSLCKDSADCFNIEFVRGGEILPPANPSCKCLLALARGLWLRHAFFMSSSVVLTQPGWN